MESNDIIINADTFYKLLLLKSTQDRYKHFDKSLKNILHELEIDSDDLVSFIKVYYGNRPEALDLIEKIQEIPREPILEQNAESFVIFPTEHQDLWQFYKRQEAGVWRADEIDLDGDVQDWNNLNENEFYLVSHAIAFFVASHGVIKENLTRHFVSEVRYIEAKYFYELQVAIENIHAEVYSLLIDTCIKDSTERDRIVRGREILPGIKKKVDWANRWIDKGSFQERLVAFAAIETIFFATSFCSVFWLKTRNLMPGLCFLTDLTARQKTLHSDFGCHLYTHHVESKMSKERVLAIISDAVAIEKEFASNALPVSAPGINPGHMDQYIDFVTDRLLVKLIGIQVYQAVNPFDFTPEMDEDKLAQRRPWARTNTDYPIERHGEQREDLNLSDDC